VVAIIALILMVRQLIGTPPIGIEAVMRAWGFGIALFGCAIARLALAAFGGQEF